MEKVIVFGGSGFLGSHVADKLSDAGFTVVIFDRRPSPYLRKNQEMIVGDILDQSSIEQVMNGATYVYNFAGIADIDEARDRPLDTVRYNVLGNALILEAARKNQIRRYIFASSAYVYSKSGAFYRCSKQSCELYIETYHEVYQLDYTILRYGSLYGPRADEKNAIYSFVREALRDGTLSYRGDPDAIREYIHVEDAARNSVEILKPEFANQHIVLTGHQPMKIHDLFRMIAEMLPHEVAFHFNTVSDPLHYNITPYSFNPKMGRKLAASFHIDMGQGILHMLEEAHHELHPELKKELGFLVEE